MKLPSRILTAAAVAALPLLAAGSASAAPLSQSLNLKNAEVGMVEEVQWRRRGWRGDRWVGPAIGGFAAGVAVGALTAPRYGDAYAYDPGYAYAPAPRAYYDYDAPRYRDNFPAARCGDADSASAYPSWACPANPRATGW